jgi:hypothetical protein
LLDHRTHGLFNACSDDRRLAEAKTILALYSGDEASSFRCIDVGDDGVDESGEEGKTSLFVFDDSFVVSIAFLLGRDLRPDAVEPFGRIAELLIDVVGIPDHFGKSNDESQPLPPGPERGLDQVLRLEVRHLVVGVGLVDSPRTFFDIERRGILPTYAKDLRGSLEGTG